MGFFLKGQQYLVVLRAIADFLGTKPGG
ncbi:hypothetical protein RSK20926_11944 [Roseobacter sp. SK209-2-6]|nr:hypothetical protein RSK20926_11944 [Roseobacter sp. SK209-2-6]